MVLCVYGVMLKLLCALQSLNIFHYELAVLICILPFTNFPISVNFSTLLSGHIFSQQRVARLPSREALSSLKKMALPRPLNCVLIQWHKIDTLGP